MRLLVTGGAGYIGGVTAALLLDHGHQVVVLDKDADRHADRVPVGADRRAVDLLDAAAVDRAFDRPFDGVLHFAALALVGESVERPLDYFRVNVGGTVNLLDAMRRYDVRRLVFSSSAATYGEPDEVPITEDAPTRPTNPYGDSKLAVDRLLGASAHAYGLAAVSLRYFNVAGTYGRQREQHDPETHLMPNVLKAAAEHRPFRLHGTDYPTPDGTCIRDYVHVADLAEAHLLALAAAAPGEHRVYNIGSGSGYSNREVLDVAQRVVGRPIAVEEGPRRAGDPARLIASSERIERDLGWVRRRDLEDMARDTWSAMQA